MLYMPKNLIWAVIISGIAAGLVSCASQAAAPPPPPATEEVLTPDTPEPPEIAGDYYEDGYYYDAEFGFSIEFPEEWEQQEGSGDMVMQVLSPLENNGDQYRENVSITAVYMTDEVTLEEFMPELKKAIAGQSQNFQAVSEGDTEISAYPAKWFAYTFTIEGIEIKGIVYVLFADGVGYSIICSATPGSFDSFVALFEEIALTFTLDSSFDLYGGEPVAPVEKDYTIQFPDGWEVQEDYSEAEMVGISPAEGDDDKFLENVTVMTEYLPEDMTFDEYVQINIDSCGSLSDSPEEVMSGKTDIGGMGAKWIKYPYGFGEDKIMMIMYVVERNGKAYMINGAAKYGNFDNYKAIFEKTAETFRLK